jgi:3-oxoisoapionate kinase
MRKRLRLGFYGDDFTGSTDSMEALALSGVRTTLFLEPPSPELLQERFPDLEAFGVAGNSRTMTPAQMEDSLTRVFEQAAKLEARIFHYKLCSTFDSSPEIGSIGRAIEIGRRVFGSPVAPLLVGAPILRRYCVFGNLFATVGEETFRLDRHPTMSRHPVTPMDEGDLRRHLARQTSSRIALFDILQLNGTPEELDQRFANLLAAGPEIVLFDALDDARMSETGRLIESMCEESTLFVAGSSGVEYALTASWRERGAISPITEAARTARPAEQVIVVSGSCSPATGEQIEWAMSIGYAGVRLDALRLADATLSEDERAAARREAIEALNEGRSVVLFSALGPEDPAIERNFSTDLRKRIGEQQGLLLRELLEATGLRRAVIAGGDTSSHAAKQLGIYALELLAPLAPGSPLCRASSYEMQFDGLEIALKGGQVGKTDYFERARCPQ